MGFLTIYPDKPHERDDSNLAKWDKSGKYICQQKVDGWRMILLIGEDEVDFVSRHDKLFSNDIQPELYAQARQLCGIFPAGTQLDSEWLSRRSCSVSNKVKGKIPAKLIIFDILRLGKKWQKSTTYEARWDILLERLGDIPDSMPDVSLSVVAEPGTFETFYEEQRKIAVSEGVVIKHKKSKMTGARNGCIKNMQHYKVKYRGGSDGEQSMDHLKKRPAKV